LEVYELRLQPELPFDSYLDFAKLARTSAGKAPFLNAKKKRRGFRGIHSPDLAPLPQTPTVDQSQNAIVEGSLDQRRKSPD
jgi:hypothetical protein